MRLPTIIHRIHKVFTSSLLAVMLLSCACLPATTASAFECKPSAGCNVCEHCCNKFILPEQCEPCALQCGTFATTTGPPQLSASSAPHAAWEISFDLDRYDSGAKTLYAFFILSLFVAMMTIVLGVQYIYRAKASAEERPNLHQSALLCFGALLLAVLTFSVCLSFGTGGRSWQRWWRRCRRGRGRGSS